MFKEASVYALKRLTAEERIPYGLRVLTMQLWPRGVSHGDIDVWIPSAAPPLDLLRQLRRQQIGWDRFLEVYRLYQERSRYCRVVTYEGGEKQDQTYPYSALDHLCLLEQQHGTIALLCWEPGQQCHRYILKEVLEERQRAKSAELR